jgi:hypothetical protein
MFWSAFGAHQGATLLRKTPAKPRQRKSTCIVPGGFGQKLLHNILLAAQDLPL